MRSLSRIRHHFAIRLAIALVMVVAINNDLRAQSNYATPYTFSTLAGTVGTPGAVNGTGNASSFNNPQGIAVDGNGNVLVADTNNGLIRKITPDGASTVIAGQTPGGVPFDGPVGIALDGSGIIYVTDADTIRKITTDGVVHILAGSTTGFGSTDGTGAAARFNRPFGVALDLSGNLYVTDYFNSTIRKITSAGKVTTLAGDALKTGTTDAKGSLARFNQPAGIAVDAGGNVFVADSANHTIRKIAPDGSVSTFAGSAGNRGSIDGTGTAAQFDYPTGLAIDAGGNLYVSEYSDCLIRKITPNAVVTTIAGLAAMTGSADGSGSSARFDGPSGVAVTSGLDVFVADTANDTIRLGTPGSRTTQTVSFPAIGDQVFGYAPITLGATASSGEPVAYTIVSGPAVLDGSLFLTGTGTVTVEASQGGTVSYTGASATQTFTVVPAGTNGVKGIALVNLGPLSFTYDGSSKPVTATTKPVGLSVDLTYNGNSVAPSAPGSYAVVATVNDPDYQGSATGTMTILPATRPVIGGSLKVTGPANSPFSYQITASGFVNSYGAVGLPAGLSIDANSGAITGTPTTMGTSVVTLSATNGAGTTTAKLSLTVTKAVAEITLGNLQATYDGKAHPASATTAPAGLAVKFTYNNSAYPPTTGGSYSVIATVDSTLYTGTATGTLVIANSTASVILGNLNFSYTGEAHAATATTVPARLPVTFSYAGGSEAPAEVGSYPVTASVSTPDYTGSASGTLTISPISPVGATTAPSAVTAATATLNATMNPEDSDTTVTFQFGTTTTYGMTTPGQDLGAGRSSLAVSAPISGLSPSTTYHYRVVANNGGGTVDGADMTFTTLAAPAVYLGAADAQVSYWVNPGGVATTVLFEYSTSPNGTFIQTAPQNLGKGTVPVDVLALLSGLEPGTTYYYRIVTTTGTGSPVDGPLATFTTLGFETTLVAATGTTTGTTYASLGNAAVNSTDGVAFRATLAGGSATTGIWANQGTSALDLIARTGSEAPGTGGAVFATLTDPVYNNNNAVAFGGTLKVATGLVTRVTASGVWSTGGGSLQLVAREGGVAPGTNGGTFEAFSSLGLSDSGGVILMATLNPSTSAGVTTANDVGIWEGNSTGDLHLVLRLGDNVGGYLLTKLVFPLGATSGTAQAQRIASSKVFIIGSETPVNSPTQGFASNTGDFVCGASLSDNTSGIIGVIGGVPQVVAKGSEQSFGGDSTTNYASFAAAEINIHDRVAFTGTTIPALLSGANETGLWAEDENGNLQLVVAVTNPFLDGVLGFSNPVYNDNEAVAFIQTSGDPEVGIYDSSIDCTSGGTLGTVAELGEPAPGCASGVTFSSFESLGLANVGGATNQGGVIFMATLSGTGVTAANNTGIFAEDDTGAVQLIVRTGDVLIGKTITALSFLPTESGGNALAAGQTRSFSAATGDLVYNATFSDKSQAIFNVVYPP
jgi:sugar lactone lactonase YvrE